MTEILITPAGFEQLTRRLAELKSEGRREIAERLRLSMATAANPLENADYQAARDDQAELESRIARLEQRLDAARVTGPDSSNDIVDLGERVRLQDLDSGARLKYELVGTFEGDPAAGRISVASPIGQALIGRRRGDIAVALAPKGRRRFKVLAIESARRRASVMRGEAVGA